MGLAASDARLISMHQAGVVLYQKSYLFITFSFANQMGLTDLNQCLTESGRTGGLIGWSCTAKSATRGPEALFSRLETPSTSQREEISRLTTMSWAMRISCSLKLATASLPRAASS